MLDQKILHFLSHLTFDVPLPAGIEVMNPFSESDTQRAVKAFYRRYYHDQNPRYCIVGINPGRFGGGITGIPFTDPIRLEEVCGIESPWPKKQELSSLFIYDMMARFGGAEAFYSQFYFTSVSPLGFTRAGKNLNYYDDRQLMTDIEPFAVDCLHRQLQWGLHNSVAFCLGEGENYRYLSKLNAKHNLFGRIVPLPHPRFIMQYRLKRKEEFIDRYLGAFSAVA